MIMKDFIYGVNGTDNCNLNYNLTHVSLVDDQRRNNRTKGHRYSADVVLSSVQQN